MCPSHPSEWLVWQLSAWLRPGWCGNSLTSSWKSGGSTARTRPQRRRWSAQRASLTKGNLQGVSMQEPQRLVSLPLRHNVILCVWNTCETRTILLLWSISPHYLNRGLFCWPNRWCSQWGCEVWGQNITTGKKSQSFVEMKESRREKLSEGVPTMWHCLYTTSNFVYGFPKELFELTKKPYINVPLGLKLPLEKVQCYCLLEMCIINMGSLWMGRGLGRAGFDALTG